MKRTALTIVAAGIVAATVVLGIALWALWPDSTTEHHDTVPSQSEHADHDHGSDHDHAIADPLAPDNATITAATEQAFRAISPGNPSPTTHPAMPFCGRVRGSAANSPTPQAARPMFVSPLTGKPGGNRAT